MLNQSPAFQSVQHLCQQWMWKCVLPDLMLYRVGLVLSWRKGQGAEGMGICVLVCEEGVSVSTCALSGGRSSFPHR